MVHLTAQQAQPWLADVERSLLCSHLNCTHRMAAKFGQSLMSKMTAEIHGRHISLPFVLFARWRGLQDLKSSIRCKG
jgi:hypothetical protein